MFHDRFVFGDHDYFPFWRIVPPAGDDQNTRVWADPESNILVVLFSTPPADPMAPLIVPGDRFETTQAVFGIGSPHEFIVRTAERDTLVVMSPDGTVQRAKCFGNGAAARLHHALRDIPMHATVSSALESSEELPVDVREMVRTMHSPSHK
jgi:hypothetical protein